SGDRVVFRGRPETRKFLGFYVKDGLVRAAVGINRGGDPEDPKADGELKSDPRPPQSPARAASRRGRRSAPLGRDRLGRSREALSDGVFDDYKSSGRAGEQRAEKGEIPASVARKIPDA